MRYVWDEDKRRLNLTTHGVDFADILRFQWQSAIFRPTYSGRFGGRRFKAIGRLDGDLYAGTFGALGREAVALISFRRASRQERREYEQSQAS